VGACEECGGFVSREQRFVLASSPSPRRILAREYGAPMTRRTAIEGAAQCRDSVGTVFNQAIKPLQQERRRRVRQTDAVKSPGPHDSESAGWVNPYSQLSTFMTDSLPLIVALMLALPADAFL
jgi:hypothetical protein